MTSNHQSESRVDNATAINAKRNMNFDPMGGHRKNMSSRDQLLTPTSGMSDTELKVSKAKRKTTMSVFHPSFPGKRGSQVAPMESEGIDEIEPMTAVAMINNTHQLVEKI
jgi:hypothetical protein